MTHDSSQNHFKYTFDNVQNLAQFADTKAYALLGIHALIITIFSGAMLVENVREEITNSVLALFFIFGGLLLLISAYYSIMVIIPSEAKDVDADERSLFYYKHIAAFKTHKEFYKNFENSSDKTISEDIAHQAHVVSKIVDEKFTKVKLSLYSTLGYLTFFVIGAIILLLSE